MYSHEIQNLLNYKNNIVNLEDFLNIYDSSQVCCVFYDEDEDIIQVYTKDNWEFNFKVDLELKLQE